jgi:tetratricopeptide (TPR) repeat protein
LPLVEAKKQMTTLAQTCPQCGWTFDVEALRANTCKKCRSALLVTSIAYLEKFDSPAIQKYITKYAEVLKGTPDDQDALLAIGICYVRLGLFDFADRYLQRLLAAHPEQAGGYYYRAICILKGRRPRTASMNLIREIEQLALTAMTLEPSNARYDLLLAAIRHDYYVLNGLRVPEPKPPELLSSIAIKHLDQLEAEQMFQLLKMDGSLIEAAIRGPGRV